MSPTNKTLRKFDIVFLGGYLSPSAVALALMVVPLKQTVSARKISNPLDLITLPGNVGEHYARLVNGQRDLNSRSRAVHLGSASPVKLLDEFNNVKGIVVTQRYCDSMLRLITGCRLVMLCSRVQEGHHLASCGVCRPCESPSWPPVVPPNL